MSGPDRKDMRDVVVGYLAVLVILKVFYELRHLVIGRALWLLVPLTFVLVPLLFAQRRRETFESLGIHLHDIKPALRLALKVALVTLPPFAGLFYFWTRYIPPGKVLSLTPLGWASIVVFQFFYIALPEELFYRGYIQGKLNRVYPPIMDVGKGRIGYSLPISAVLFAFGHFFINFHPYRFGVFFPALIFGWMRERSGGILAPAIYHALCNILVIGLEQAFY